jgi:hypothetical protein
MQVADERIFERFVPTTRPPEEIEDDGFITVYPTLNLRAAEIHSDNVRAGWWTDLLSGGTLEGVDEHGRHRRNVGELLMLCVTEVTEAAEGHAGDLMDDKLPHRKMLEVELADTGSGCST